MRLLSEEVTHSIHPHVATHRLVDFVSITPFNDAGDVTNYPEATVSTWSGGDSNCTANCGYPGMSEWQGGHIGSSRISTFSLLFPRL